MSDRSPAARSPPVAPTKPHTWERPTGPAEDPYAWLRDREDPDTIAYLEAENAYAAAFFDQHGDLVEKLFEEIKSRVQETDESVPVRHGPWWYVTRTIEGQSYPVFCRGRADRRRRRRRPRLQRRGRGPRLLRRPRRRPVAGPHAAGLVERRRRRRALHAAGPRPRHRRRPPRRADRHLVVGRPGLVERRSVAVLRPARRADAAVPDLAAPPRHARRATIGWSSRSPTSASTSTSRRRAASSGSSSPAPARRAPRSACIPADDPTADPVLVRAAHGQIWSTPSTTGATASSS